MMRKLINFIKRLLGIVPKVENLYREIKGGNTRNNTQLVEDESDKNTR